MNLSRSHNHSPLHRRLLHVLFGALLLSALATVPSSAQEDEEEPTSEKLDEIRQEEQEVRDALADTARGIDGTLAEIEQLVAAMDALDTVIKEQQLAARVAGEKLKIAERRLAESTEAVEAAEIALADLEQQLRSRAVASFVGQDVDTPDIVYTTNPGLTVRMEALLEAILQGEADIADAYLAVQNELAVEREVARVNRIAAEELRIEIETVQRRLEADQAIQLELLAATEARLEHLLNEQQSLESQKQDLADEKADELDRLAALLRAASYSGPGGLAGPVATPEEIVWVRGIAIHNSIADQLEAMLAAAAADGITLTGGGWRDPAAQIRLRRAHCGTSEYAVWEAPASSCRPPTARPGSSYHERGLAIDFSENGRSINSPNSRAYLWLKQHAAEYGFYNLPTERWHWSTTGR